MKPVPARVAVGVLLLSSLCALLIRPVAAGKASDEHGKQEALLHAPTDSASVVARSTTGSIPTGTIPSPVP